MHTLTEDVRNEILVNQHIFYIYHHVQVHIMQKTGFDSLNSALNVLPQSAKIWGPHVLQICPHIIFICGDTWRTTLWIKSSHFRWNEEHSKPYRDYQCYHYVLGVPEHDITCTIMYWFKRIKFFCIFCKQCAFSLPKTKQNKILDFTMQAGQF